MKINSLLFLAVMLFASTGFAQGDEGAVVKKEAVFTWTQASADDQSPTIHEFGKIPQGVPASHEYWFENTGTDTLKIANVKKTCGCTTPKWSTEPIPPGGKGWVKATYNAAAMGKFHKAVIVSSNAQPANFQLFLKGEVVAKDAINMEDDSMIKSNGEKDKVGGQ